MWVTPILYRIHPYYDESKTSISDLGTFGDSAGFFNSIFSAMAFIAVIFTLWYQLKKDDKDEHRAMINQFRDHCFTLMTMLSEIVAQLKITRDSSETVSFSYSGSLATLYQKSNVPQGENATGESQSAPKPKIEITGRACFKYIYDEAPAGQNIKQWIAINVGNQPNSAFTEENYKSLRKIMGHNFDHYFRTLYRILLFIRDYELTGVDEKEQANIREHCADMLRAQLSTFEMAMMYYNALFPAFRNTSKRLYEEFCIFDNLDPLILCNDREVNYYQKCKKDGIDGPEYKETLHYRYYAFYKSKDRNLVGCGDIMGHTTHNNVKVSLGKFWQKVYTLCKKPFCNSKTSKITDLEEDERKIYEYLKVNQNISLAKKKIAKECQIGKERTGTVLYKLENTHRLITSELRDNGKRYRVL